MIDRVFFKNRDVPKDLEDTLHEEFRTFERLEQSNVFSFYFPPNPKYLSKEKLENLKKLESSDHTRKGKCCSRKKT